MNLILGLLQTKHKPNDYKWKKVTQYENHDLDCIYIVPPTAVASVKGIYLCFEEKTYFLNKRS